VTESFFDRLELELRAAAGRPPRRLAGGMRGPAVALAVAAAIAIAVVPAAVLLGGGDERADNPPADRAEPPAVGTVIPKGEGTPPRYDGDHTVVATGTAPFSGPWQLETYQSTRLTEPETGEELQPAGLGCLGVILTDPPPQTPNGGGYCGEQRRTPGFTRGQVTVPPVPHGANEVLVYGRTPEEAAKVVLTVDGVIRKEFEPYPGPAGVDGDFYLIPVKPEATKNGRVNWLDAEGNEGSRGTELLPP
jgi:hypothetical protein